MYNCPPSTYRYVDRKTTVCLTISLILAIFLLSACGQQPAQISQPPDSVKSKNPEKEHARKPDYEKIIADVKTKHGPIAAARVEYWVQLIKNGKRQQENEKLEKTNQFFNEAKFLSDEEVWQQADYWATPVEFLVRDAGDCEDFSIAKYLTLDLMGMDISKLRITYVEVINYDQPHMVLAYYPTPDSIPLILDNINPRILSADLRDDLTPIYSFNGTTLWLARSRNEQLKSGDSQQIKMWRHLTDKIFRELGVETDQAKTKLTGK